MADRRGALIPLLILSFIFFTPAPPQRGAQYERHRIEDVIIEEQRSLEAVRNSSYGIIDGANRRNLNLTGLEPDRGYAWDSLSKIKERAGDHLEYVLGDWGRQAVGGHIIQDSPVPLYRNATGLLHGKWLRSKLHDSVPIPQLNLSNYAPEGPFGPMEPRPFGRNITGSGGDLKFHFHENELLHSTYTNDGPLNITRMKATMAVSDEESSEEWGLEAYGVYFVELGQAILTTTSSKFAGIFMLPHFALSEHTFNASRAFLNASLSKTIERQFEYGFQASPNPWSSKTDDLEDSPFANPDCDVIIYLQQLEPLGMGPSYSSATLSFLERELRFPTGAFLPREPELRFSMLAFSPDCGFVIESKGPPDHIPQDGNHLLGAKIEVLQYTTRRHLLVFALASGLQLVLQMRQMREASTPSTRSRVSFYTVAMLAFGDAFTTIAIFLCIALRGLGVSLIGTAFLTFIGGAFFGMRFLLDVWLVQAPERARREREQIEEERQRQERLNAALQRIREERRAAIAASATARNTPGDESTEIPDSQPLLSSQEPAADSLPLPVQAARPTDTGATPVFMPSDQEGLEPIDTATAANDTTAAPNGLSGFSTIYTRFYLFLLFTLFLTINAVSWPSFVRRVYFALISLVYLSFWLPQIKRNIQRNSRRALNREYVVGQSILRLIPFAYFYAYEQNVLLAQPDPYVLVLLATWIWAQVVILGSQDLLGPRWFVPKGWAPDAYDYHPVLRADTDEEGGDSLPLGLSDSAQQSAPSSPRARRASISAAPKDKDTREREKKGAKGSGVRIFDCAICMQELEVPVVESSATSNATDSAAHNSLAGAGGLLARRMYMVTPCRHIFHNVCLEGWMKYRLQCPICREPLPGL